MDINEINDIARRLTQQWTAIIRDRVLSPKKAQEDQFLRQLESNGRIVFEYEKQELQDKAMDCIPLQRLYEEAEDKIGEEGSLQDMVIQRLLHWFKNEFFTWVNNLPCDYCKNTNTRSVGSTQPSQEDLLYGAHVVESYQCNACNRITRFPRYNDPGKLLETRRGRCGEWANVFTLCCRAVGSEARIVYDTTDHVWTEVYSEDEHRWIHCDSCEEAWDRPLLYSIGWNKQLSYCTAFSIDEAIDVTKRYTRNWSDVLKRRNKIGEDRLAKFLDDLTTKRQLHLDEKRIKELGERHVKELAELEEDSRKLIVKDDEMVGRQSGSLAWRTSRGETGESTNTENIMIPLDTNDLKAEKIEAQFTLLGSASMQYDGRSLLPDHPFIRITSSLPDQRGGVYCKQEIQLDEHLKGIELEFAFRITNAEGQTAINGADGFAFVIQAQGNDALGGGGCELGYGGIKNCLAIEFDTYQSSDRCADPSANHISVHGRKPPYANSAHQDYSLGHTSRIPSLQSGQWMKSKIRLLQNGTIEVGLAEANDKEYIQVLKVSNQNFMDYLEPKEMAWMGFTASTGGLAENHDVQWISLIKYTTLDK